MKKEDKGLKQHFTFKLKNFGPNAIINAKNTRSTFYRIGKRYVPISIEICYYKIKKKIKLTDTDI